MKRAFIYLGKDERISEDVERFGQSIDEIYHELLGERRYEQLKLMNGLLLRANSYFSNLSEFERFGMRFSANTCSKFVFATGNKEINLENGLIGIQEPTAAPAFYVSEKSFMHSGARKYTDKPIGTYIHEFNHYLAFALQRVPMYMLTVILAQNTGGQLKKAEQYADLFNRVLTDASPLKEKRKMIAYAMIQGVLDDGYEQINTILDSRVFKAIGARVPTEWRGTQKNYFAIQIEGIGVFALPASGDFYRGLSDKEALNRFLQWEDHFVPKGAAIGVNSNELMQNISNIFEKTKRIRVKKISLENLIKLEENNTQD